VASTLVSLIGAILVSEQVEWGVSLSFTVAGLAGAVGVFAMIAGAAMLVRETRFSFRILQEERKFLDQHVSARVAELAGAAQVTGS
jgi:hypothetical protein